jgi:glycosyltransferase involved in cell wall biosynthesis
MPGDAPVARLEILHVVESFASGTMEVVRTVANRHAEAGCRVGIAYGVRPETPTNIDELVDARVALVGLPWRDRTPRSQLTAARALRSLLTRSEPGVVHLHSTFAALLGSLAISRDVPTVMSPHAFAFAMRDRPMLARGVLALAEAFAGSRATVVGAVSYSEAELARRWLRLTNIRTVRNGIPELDHLPEIRRSAGPHRVVAMGRVGPQHQPERACRILRAVSDRARVLWIGGDRSEDGALPHAAAIHGVQSTGWLSRTRAVSALADATIYLHWTAWDGLSMSVLEALARDVVVIASDIPSNREVLGADQVCATEQEAIHLIAALLASPARWAASLRAQRLRSQSFGATRMAAEWLALYRSVAR